jgi:hypothetical protein
MTMLDATRYKQEGYALDTDQADVLANDGSTTAVWGRFYFASSMSLCIGAFWSRQCVSLAGRGHDASCCCYVDLVLCAEVVKQRKLSGQERRLLIACLRNPNLLTCTSDAEVDTLSVYRSTIVIMRVDSWTC